MNKKAQTLYQKELEAEGVFDARNIPETPTLLVRLLHHKPKEWGCVIDVFIEPDDPNGRRIRVTCGDYQFEKGVKLVIIERSARQDQL